VKLFLDITFRGYAHEIKNFESLLSLAEKFRRHIREQKVTQVNDVENFLRKLDLCQEAGFLLDACEYVYTNTTFEKMVKQAEEELRRARANKAYVKPYKELTESAMDQMTAAKSAALPLFVAIGYRKRPIDRAGYLEGFFKQVFAAGDDKMNVPKEFERMLRNIFKEHPDYAKDMDFRAAAAVYPVVGIMRLAEYRFHDLALQMEEMLIQEIGLHVLKNRESLQTFLELTEDVGRIRKKNKRVFSRALDALKKGALEVSESEQPKMSSDKPVLTVLDGRMRRPKEPKGR
jgi:hypothetical protein